MSRHSYSRCWLHIIWGTLERRKSINKAARVKISTYLYEYSRSKEIYMKVNYVNADHVHTIIDLPAKYSIKETVRLLKGGSSHWINKNGIIANNFSWGRGYGVFSVSQSNIQKVIKYINNQEEHHKKKSFMDEFKSYIKIYESPD